MLKNYFLLAFRNLSRQKKLAGINIIGLSIGLTCFYLFLFFAVSELNYNRSHANAATTYRLIEWFEGRASGDAVGGTPQGPALKREFADVEEFVRVQTSFDEKMIRAGNHVLRSKLSFADPSIFNVFTLQIKHGNARALENPRHIVLTEQRAKQLFGKTDVVGQTVEINYDGNFEPFIVGAVVAELPYTSSVQFSVLGAFEHLLSTPFAKPSLDDWNMMIGCETYLKLREGSSLPRDARKLASFRQKYYPGEAEAFKKEGAWSGSGPLPVQFRLQPLLTLHTESQVGGLASTINPSFIWTLIAIAAGILMIACINFTTLAIGRSAGRAKEVGVRKVMGGVRKQVILQFLVESLTLCTIAAAIAIFLSYVLLPLFNQLAGTSIVLSITEYPELIWMTIGVLILSALLAGLYPALLLSGFSPLEVLKSKLRIGGSNLFTRSLVTGQFVLSIGLIIATIIILDQLEYMRNKNVGFHKQNVIVVNAAGINAARIFPLFRHELQSAKGVKIVAASEMNLGEGAGLMGTAFDHKGETKGVITYPVDGNYVDALGFQLLAGRKFNSAYSIDTTSSVIVNEAMLRDFGLTIENAVGAQLQEKRYNQPPINRTIIGVVRDFHFSSLSENIRAQMFYQPTMLDARHFFVRITEGDPGPALASISAAWKKLVPDLPIEYSFLDQNLDRFYKNEERWAKIGAAAGIICISLACLGLFGLATLAAVNKTKEIGIRKVLGASIHSIVQLLLRDFVKLVLMAIVIAIPLAWWLMHEWLENYAYRITIGWHPFVLTGLAAMLIAAITVGSQAIRKAIANPVISLRDE